MDFLCAYDKLEDIAKLVENPRNPNKHTDKQIDLLSKIMLAQGFRRPIVVSKRSGFVVCGHGRLAAAKKLGLDKVPVDYQDYPSEAAEWADMVADNKIAEMASMDDMAVAKLLAECSSSMDLELFGMQDAEANKLLSSFARDNLQEDNFDETAALVKAKTAPRTKPGDLWILGTHRLICGSATDAAVVDRLMDGKLASMVFTDPPYNVNIQGSGEKKLKIKNDNLPKDAFLKLIQDAMKNCSRSMKPGAGIYVCYSDSEAETFRDSFRAAGLDLKQCLIWLKNSFVLGRADYQWRHEPILYGWKPGAKHSFYGGRAQSSVIDDLPLIVEKHEHSFTITVVSGTFDFQLEVPEYKITNMSDTGTVWRVDKPVKDDVHPTMKPIALCGRAISNSSKRNEIVLDLFGGSGSTMIAAEQLQRTCYMTELDPVYCDVIINRWENLTARKAVKK